MVLFSSNRIFPLFKDKRAICDAVRHVPRRWRVALFEDFVRARALGALRYGMEQSAAETLDKRGPSDERRVVSRRVRQAVSVSFSASAKVLLFSKVP